ncbi:hypothetical protein [Halolamina rubra]|uniref:hypothetical protein n=1 Tax=Halolamina rubra TaxID=1380430 RepID=UPI00067877E7|nr:hypothetical protein [Halolamina rubra]
MVDDSRPATPPQEPRVATRPHALDGPLPRPQTLWLVAVLAMVLDVALTGLGLSMGLAERNWIARAFIREFGLIGAGVLLKGFALAVGYAAWRLLPLLTREGERYRYLVPVGVAIPSWAAVAVNAATILAVA